MNLPVTRKFKDQGHGPTTISFHAQNGLIVVGCSQDNTPLNHKDMFEGFTKNKISLVLRWESRKTLLKNFYSNSRGSRLTGYYFALKGKELDSLALRQPKNLCRVVSWLHSTLFARYVILAFTIKPSRLGRSEQEARRRWGSRRWSLIWGQLKGSENTAVVEIISGWRSWSLLPSSETSGRRRFVVCLAQRWAWLWLRKLALDSVR